MKTQNWTSSMWLISSHILLWIYQFWELWQTSQIFANFDSQFFCTKERHSHMSVDTPFLRWSLTPNDPVPTFVQNFTYNLNHRFSHAWKLIIYGSFNKNIVNSGKKKKNSHTEWPHFWEPYVTHTQKSFFFLVQTEWQLFNKLLHQMLPLFVLQ